MTDERATQNIIAGIICALLKLAPCSSPRRVFIADVELLTARANG